MLNISFEIHFSAIQLMADFPRSTYTVEIQRFSEPEKLLLLPPVEKLEIKQHILDSEPITVCSESFADNSQSGQAPRIGSCNLR